MVDGGWWMVDGGLGVVDGGWWVVEVVWSVGGGMEASAWGSGVGERLLVNVEPGQREASLQLCAKHCFGQGAKVRGPQRLLCLTDTPTNTICVPMRWHSGTREKMLCKPVPGENMGGGCVCVGGGGGGAVGKLRKQHGATS